MMSSKGNNYAMSEIIASKIFAMNEKLDQVVHLAHCLEVQNKAMLGEDALESEVNKILPSPVSTNRQILLTKQNYAYSAVKMLTSTPMRAKLTKRSPNWSSLTPAEQLEILHEVANEHTKVSLDYDGLRRSVVASQKVIALQNAFHLVRASGEDKSNEEQEYVLDLMDSNVESTKILSTLMDEYTVAQIKSLELKTELAREWSNLRQFYATNFADANDENDAGTMNVTPSTSQALALDKKKASLREEEKKCEQIKMLTQKLMMSFPNLNIDSSVVPIDAQQFRETFSRCGKSIEQLKSEMSP